MLVNEKFIDEVFENRELEKWLENSLKSFREVSRAFRESLTRIRFLTD